MTTDQPHRKFSQIILGIVFGIVVGVGIGLYFITDLFMEKTANKLSEPVIAPPDHVDLVPAPITFGAISYADAVDKARPAVANIYTTKMITRPIHPFYDDPFFRRFFGGRVAPQRQQQQNSLGSGVILSTQGYVITNNHVIEGADEILVALNDGRSAAAAVVGTDPETDIAVLKINLDDLQAIYIGQSDLLRVGDVVLAIGNPFGVGQTVTQGIVSATGRHQLGLSTFENFIQTDAAINPGNSGGALINTSGELIGINTAIFSKSGGSEGIGFAIPINLAKTVMQQIIQYGHAVRGWLGIDTAQVLSPALAKVLGIPGTNGVIIKGVIKSSPADIAGLQPGDIIIAINEQEITSPYNAMSQIIGSPPGVRLNLKILRDHIPMTVEAEIGTRPQTR